MKAYGYFCEDEAIETFIDKALSVIGPTTRCQGFIKRTNPLAVPNGRNSAMIKKNFPDAITLAFATKGEQAIDLFFVAYDYDDTNRESLNLHIEQQKAKINIQKRGKTLFCIPVQCIEYWLWYIKYANEETLPNSLETNNMKKRKDIKDEVYGRASSVTGQLAISIPLLEQLNIERLQSLSFLQKLCRSDQRFL